MGLAGLAVVNEVRYVAAGRPSVQVAPAFAVALALVTLSVALACLRLFGHVRSFAFIGVAIVLCALVLGYVVQRSYLPRRYENVDHAVPYAAHLARNSP